MIYLEKIGDSTVLRILNLGYNLKTSKSNEQG